MLTPHRLPRMSRIVGMSLAIGSLAALGSLAVLGSAAASAAGARAAATPACQTGGLVVWLDTQGNGTAGSVIYTMTFTNLSGRTCTLRGYPGVSAVNLAGSQLGAAASRDTGTAVKTVTLKNGGAVTAQLRIVEAGNFSPSACGQTTAAGLRVFPPNQKASKVIPFPFAACSRSGAKYLTIRAVK